MSFSEQEFLDVLTRIPEGDVWRRMRSAMLSEMERREHLKEVRATANAGAWAYYSAAPLEKKDELLVWVPPLAPPLGWPTDMRVWHAGRVWVQTSPDLSMSEPGSDGDTDWVEEPGPPGA